MRPLAVNSNDVEAVDGRIQYQIARARLLDVGGGWITYLIRDPRRPDRKGNAAGWPIYVGQTDEFGRRVRNHLRKSEKLARRGTGIKQRMKELLHAGIVPNFEAIDRQPTRLQSLLSETNFARLCRSRGYDIANATTLQNRAGPPVAVKDLPTKWLWKFSLEQAVQDELLVEVVCTGCRTVVPLDIRLFEALPEPPKRLEDVRAWSARTDEPCETCRQKSQRRVRVRIP